MTENLDEMTLDPPGRIAVIGAGPLGLEAALYGRFLGYDVTVFERAEVGQSLRAHEDQPLPVLPSECLSSLAWSAISAQQGGGETMPAASLPLTIGQWLAQGLQPLANSDLLRGRVQTGTELVRIELVEVALEPGDQTEQTAGDHVAAEEVAGEEAVAGAVASAADGGDADDGDAGDWYHDDGEVPADFRLTLRPLASDAAAAGATRADDFEALILAVGASDVAAIAGLEQCLESPYFFRLGDTAADAAPGLALTAGRQEIVRVFARLGGRSNLDLYRPIRF